MTKQLTRNTSIYFRVNQEQQTLLNQAYKQWLNDRSPAEDKIPTLSEFVRQIVMIACLKKLRVLEMIKDEIDLSPTNEETPNE